MTQRARLGHMSVRQKQRRGGRAAAPSRAAPELRIPPWKPRATGQSLPPWATRALLGLLLVALVVAYLPLIQNQFVNYDDELYVTQNPTVKAGLTWEGLVWAFTTGHASNWHPLTWLSHMLDCQLWGLAPAGHHLTGLALHAVTSLLLWRLVARATGRFWVALFTAAAFALHPLHVESVAWAAERKDVLCAFFFIAGADLYLSYVARPSLGRYFLVAVAFCLALLSKPMAVSFPLVLLILDVWPLGRLAGASSDERSRTARLLVREKLPLAALAALSCAITYWVQSSGTAMQATGGIDLASRIGNALVSGAVYLRQLAVPTGLAVFYPYRAPPAAAVLGALLLLGGLTAAAVALRSRLPFLLAGLLWFGVMLVPVIGIVQVGLQAHADRYAYLPSIGVFVAVGCLVERWCRDRSALRWPVAALAAAVVVVWTAGTFAQVRVWRDSISLFEHALQVTSDNFQAHHNLGTALADAGRTAEAVQQFEETLRIRPDHFMAQGNLGIALMKTGENEKALAKFNYVLSVTPRDFRAHNNIASALMNLGRIDEAIAHFRQALEIAPNHPALKANLAAALQRKADRDGAGAKP